MDQNTNQVDLQNLKEVILHENLIDKVHHSDMADYLERVKKENEEEFFTLFKNLPLEKRAQTFLELPTAFQVDLIQNESIAELAIMVGTMDSDDATDVMSLLTKTDRHKSEEVLDLLSDDKQEEIEKLTHYEDNEAGSLMQSEVLKIKSSEKIADAINKLAYLKAQDIGRIESLFITDEQDKLLKNIFMDDLILHDPQEKFSDFMDTLPEPPMVTVHEKTDTTLNMIEKYDLSVLAVVDKKGRLIGRITHDDVVDRIQNRATQQMYNLNKLHADEEIQETFTKTGQTRAIWLSINLVNAILASLVIGLFSETLEAIVALAVLMPIVANMAGTASVQTMTVVVRQMGLGEIHFHDIRPVLIKEINMSILNGLLFAILSAGTAQLWFGNTLISLAIGLSMWVSFISAGILGAMVPMLLKKVHLDPAVASSVVVITLVDIIGFFSFLWFSELIIL